MADDAFSLLAAGDFASSKASAECAHPTVKVLAGPWPSWGSRLPAGVREKPQWWWRSRSLGQAQGLPRVGLTSVPHWG